VILFSLTACSLVSKQPIKGKYKDGTYTEEGDKWQYGNENATVIIRDGKIAGITLRKIDKIGKEVNYDQWIGKNINGNIKPNLKEYRINLVKKMSEKQTYDVDAIAGATISSENWKRAVHRALDKASR
jgi:uncharacterized protein with FMN-binding domain